MATTRPPKRRRARDTLPVRPRWSGATGTGLTPGKIDAFLEAIATGSEDSEAAEYASTTMKAINKRRREDPEFRAAYQAARQTRIEVYRAEAKRRAIDGWLEPVFFRGEQVGVVRKFSDRLLEKLLEAEAPDEFGDRKVVEILTSPMTGADVARAAALGAAAGGSDDLMAALELVARQMADAEVLQAIEQSDGSFEVTS